MNAFGADLHADRTIVVTGAWGGIGFATTTMLLERGARVVLADRDAGKPEQRDRLARWSDRVQFSR